MQTRVADEVATVAGRLLDQLLQQPLLGAAIVLAAALGLATLLYLVRRLTRTDGDRFVAAMADCRAVSVLMHPNPDPDAMASVPADSASAAAESADAIASGSGFGCISTETARQSATAATNRSPSVRVSRPRR